MNPLTIIFLVIVVVVILDLVYEKVVTPMLNERDLSAAKADLLAEAAKVKGARAHVKTEWQSIQSNIKERVNDGATYLCWPYRLYPENLERLQKLGYTFNDELNTIEWGKKP